MALRLCEKLGISVELRDALSLSDGIRFLSPGLAIDAAFPNGASGMGVRRTVLHRLIAERASSMGIDFLWQTPVTGISPNGSSSGKPQGERALDHWRRRRQFASAALGRA